MSGLLASLSSAARELPANLRRGLWPGPREGDGPRERMRRNFVYHLHPVKVTERALSPWVTLGLGLVTLTLFLSLALTGVLLMVYYVPTTVGAYPSMQDIQHAVAFGPFVRALHRWAAHAMVATVLLHLVRVWANAAWRGRELNWLFGLTLLGLTLGLAFTGYLLPWDQLSFWAVSVAAGLLDHVPWAGNAIKSLAVGGRQIGQATLVRFYALHVAVLPGAALALVALHLWRIRRDHGLARPAAGPEGEPTVGAWPHLVLREAIVMLAALAALVLFSALVDAPLGPPPDLHAPSNPEKAPWYFLWLQEMVSYSAPVGGFVFPGATLLLLVLLPFLDRSDESVGRWFAEGRARWTALASLAVAAAAFVVLEAAYLRFGGSIAAGSVARDLLNPAAGMLALAVVAFVASGRISGSVRAASLAGLGVLLVAVLGCTVVGMCRGPGWVFLWPWEAWPVVL